MRNDVLLQKRYHYAVKLINYSSGYAYDSFIKDVKLLEACVFNLIQLGELCHAADDKLADQYPEIPWREIYGLRNRIVHDYEGVNFKLVWEIISEDIPELEKYLKQYLAK